MTLEVCYDPLMSFLAGDRGLSVSCLHRVTTGNSTALLHITRRHEVSSSSLENRQAAELGEGLG